MKFEATVELGGKTATGVEVPADVVTALGQGKRPPVTVTINGHTYRSTIAVMGGRSMLGVSAENREQAGVSAGDVVTVDVELDTAPREVEVPADLAAALAADPAAREHFESISRSKKRQLVDPIGQARTAETRARRVAKAVDVLSSRSI